MKLKHKIISAIIVVITLVVVVGISYQKANNNIVNRYLHAKEIQAKLFPNVAGMKITPTMETGLFSNKEYKNLEIKVPSFASVYDDKKNDATKASQIINTEDLDRDIESWLKESFNDKAVSKMTDHVTVWYRDVKVIDKSY